MKKVILSIALIFGCLIISSAQPTATISLPDVGSMPAGEVFTSIVVEDIAGGFDFGSFQFSVNYDPSVLTPVEVIYTNPGLQFFEWSNSLFYSPDEVVLTWLSYFGGYTPLPGEELCQVKWQYTGSPDYSDLIWGLTDSKSQSTSKGVTTVWTQSGTPYDLDLTNGSVGGSSATLSVPDLGPGIPSGSIFFPIVVDQIYGGVDSLQFYFSFDPLVLNPEDVLYPNPDFISFEWSNNLSFGTDEIELIWKNVVPAGQINVYPVPGDTLCTIQFFYSGNPDYSPLSWGQSDYLNGDNSKGLSSMWNFNDQMISLTLNDGSCGVPYQPDATLSVPHLGASQAGSVIFPITIEDLTPGESADSLKFYFSYDPNVLTPVGVIYSDSNFPLNEWSNDLNYGPDEIYLSWTSSSGPKYPVIGDSFCSIEFTYSGYPDYSDLSWGLSKGGNPKGATTMWNEYTMSYNLTLMDGSCGISGPPEASLSVPEIGSTSSGSVFFPVTIEDIIPGIDVESLQFYFIFDENVLSPLNVIFSDPDFPAFEWTNNLAYGSNEIELSWASSSGAKYPESGDVICTIEFDYSGYPDYSDLNWGLSKGATAMWNSISDPYLLTLQNGSVGPTGPNSATLTLPIMGNLPAGTVLIPIILDEINGGTYILQYYISYLPFALTPIDVIYTHPDFESAEWSNNLSFGPNEIELKWINQFPVEFENAYPQAGDTICIIKFQFQSYPHYSYLAWDLNEGSKQVEVKANSGMWDNNGESFSLTLNNGCIGSGTPVYTSLNLPDLGGGIPSGIVTTPLTVSNIVGDEKYGTFQLYIKYDPTVLTPANVNFTNPNLPFYEWSNSLTYSYHTILLTWLSFSGGYKPSSGEELCTIDWTYAGPYDYSDLHFRKEYDYNTTVWTPDGIEYTLGLNDGSIGPTCSIPPTADFSSDITSGIAPLDIQFSDLSIGECLQSWQWDFNNDDVIDSYEQNPIYTYNNPGIYSVKLIVSDETDTDTLIRTDYIIVNEVVDSNYFELKIFLEGPYLNGQMIQYLNIFDYIPLSQPYSVSPWNYSGDESLDEIPNFDVVDWVLIELRETTGNVSQATEETLIGRRAGLLLTDGTITDLDGLSPLLFEGQISHNLYIMVQHRNHRGVINSLAAVESNGYYSYDFTKSPYQTYGEILSVKDLGDGNWALPGGNGIPDGQIDNSDKNELWRNQFGSSGYFEGDYNMDGVVSLEDKTELWVLNAGSSELMPDGTSQGQWICGNLFEDDRDGQVYGTVQIGNQCWMTENMNIGNMINGMNHQLDNGIIEKYCYNNDQAYCDTLGGLYQWDEMMQYTTSEKVQGICPPTSGWHIPSDGDWQTLEGVVDSLYPCGDSEWDEIGLRGYDAGKNLKSNFAWINNGHGIDIFDFTALPSGQKNNSGVFNSYRVYGNFWTSSNANLSSAWRRYFIATLDQSGRDVYSKGYGFSVRCVRE